MAYYYVDPETGQIVLSHKEQGKWVEVPQETLIFECQTCHWKAKGLHTRRTMPEFCVCGGRLLGSGQVR